MLPACFQVLAANGLHNLLTSNDPQLAQQAMPCVPALVWMSAGTGAASQDPADALGILCQLSVHMPLQEGLVAAGAVAAISHHLGPSGRPGMQAAAVQSLLQLCQGSASACEQAVQAKCIETVFASVHEVHNLHLHCRLASSAQDQSAYLEPKV